jgi:hypothetical protein
MKNSRIDIKMACPRCGYWQFATVEEYDQSLIGKRLRCPMAPCHRQELIPTGECRVAHFPEHGSWNQYNEAPQKRGLFARFRKQKVVTAPVYYQPNPEPIQEIPNPASTIPFNQHDPSSFVGINPQSVSTPPVSHPEQNPLRKSGIFQRIFARRKKGD